jgi:hypothetical protein
MATQPQRAEYSNHVWTYDILFDRLADGRPFKTLSILDEFTRECLGVLVAPPILSQDVIAFLNGIFQQRSTPVFSAIRQRQRIYGRTCANLACSKESWTCFYSTRTTLEEWLH